MNAAKTGILFLALLALAALLGCVQNEPVACTADAMQCPDGSYVGRDSFNNCEFFPCSAQQSGERAVGPDYYGSEAEAYNALGTELDGIEGLSEPELESLLGQ
jgi:hypothetical protein